MKTKYTSLSEAIVSTMNKAVLSKKEYFIYLKMKHIFYIFKPPSKKSFKAWDKLLKSYDYTELNKKINEHIKK
jgi:hypothetical protein